MWPSQRLPGQLKGSSSVATGKGAARRLLRPKPSASAPAARDAPVTPLSQRQSRQRPDQLSLRLWTPALLKCLLESLRLILQFFFFWLESLSGLSLISQRYAIRKLQDKTSDSVSCPSGRHLRPNRACYRVSAG